MKKVKPGDESTIKIIPREYVETVTLFLRDRLTNTTKKFGVEIGTDQNFMTLTFAPEEFLVDGHQYDFWLTNYNETEKVIYRDTILCSAQEISQRKNVVYNINKDVYESHNTGDNSYIVID